MTARQVLTVMREVGGETLDRRNDPLEVRRRGARVGVGIERAVRSLEPCECVDLIAQLGPRGIGRRPVARRAVSTGACGRASPMHDVEPQRAVVEVAEAIVAEQVGVAEHDDPSVAVVGGDDQRCARRRGRRMGPREDARAVRRADSSSCDRGTPG